VLFQKAIISLLKDDGLVSLQVRVAEVVQTQVRTEVRIVVKIMVTWGPWSDNQLDW
jgi:hypothetical protein